MRIASKNVDCCNKYGALLSITRLHCSVEEGSLLHAFIYQLGRIGSWICQLRSTTVQEQNVTCLGPKNYTRQTHFQCDHSCELHSCRLHVSGKRLRHGFLDVRIQKLRNRKSSKFLTYCKKCMKINDTEAIQIWNYEMSHQNMKQTQEPTIAYFLP